MDETLPVNDACSCVSKACSSTQSMCTYMCWHTYRSEFSIMSLIFPQTHTKNVISTPLPPHPFTSAYLCSCFLCTCFNVVPEIWAVSPHKSSSNPPLATSYGSPLVSFDSAPPQPIRIFGLEQNHQPLLRSLKPHRHQLHFF